MLLNLLKDPFITGLLGAIVGLLFRQLIDYIKNTRLSIEASHRTVRLAYLRQQLEEFYWPLYAGLTRDEAVWKLRENKATMDAVDWQKVQETIESELLIPNHVTMSNIITQKLHLAGYAEPPECYEAYIRHVAAFQALRAAGRKEAPSAMGAPWPYQFNEEIQKRTSELSHQYAKLIEIVLTQSQRIQKDRTTQSI